VRDYHVICDAQCIVALLFEYCASIFVSLGETNVQRLQKLQNQGMRIILRCDRRERIVNMLEALQFMSIKERIEYNVCTLDRCRSREE
jgi:hypothetical protein